MFGLISGLDNTVYSYYSLVYHFHYFRCYLSTVKSVLQQLFILHINLSANIPNNQIMPIQIGLDTENSEHFT